MDSFLEKLNIYLIPPVLSLIVGLSLALLSIVKGKFRKENILFSLVCFWWSCLLAPAFIAHHLLRGQEELLLSIERFIHFFFVYVPFVNMLYLLDLMRLKRKKLVAATGVVCFLISLFTPTNYYFTGLHSYSWGYIARGSVAFDVFGAFGMIVIFYIAFEGFRQLRTETNYILRTKIKYVVFSLVASASLTLCNIPAINGVDFYPLGNLSFIPLSILAYGVLRFRLLDIRSILHVTVIWAVVSSIVIVPNVFLLKIYWPAIAGFDFAGVLMLTICWALANFVYLKKVQPLIDQLFSRRKYNLGQVESLFIENIAMLRSFGDLVREFTGVLKRTLSFSGFRIVSRDQETGAYSLDDGATFQLNEDLEEWFVKYNDLVEKSLVETDPIYSKVRSRFAELFSRLDAEYILPFLQNKELIGFLTIRERVNLKQLSMDEIRFINNIKAATAIALANSMMYENLSNYKNNLEVMVDKRTGELQEAKDALWGEMELAKKIQTVLLPENPSIQGYEIAGYMKMADLVGGDYYDVINTEGFDWIVIGDVSGHGVPAGLIMMMVQTSIHSVLASNEKQSPSELLDTVNGVITRNIVKLQEEKYMTITVLACGKDGKFWLSGLHQDILIYRAEKDTVEIVPTTGMWIGVEEDISELIADEELVLHKGDTMLLYSDGVTEAWPRSASVDRRRVTEMYGMDKLCQVFGDQGQETPDQIKNAVLESLKSYSFDDDVTMLVVKRVA